MLWQFDEEEREWIRQLVFSERAREAAKILTEKLERECTVNTVYRLRRKFREQNSF